MCFNTLGYPHGFNLRYKRVTLLGTSGRVEREFSVDYGKEPRISLPEGIAESTKLMIQERKPGVLVDGDALQLFVFVF